MRICLHKWLAPFMLWIAPPQFIAQLWIERLPKSTKVAGHLKWAHVGTKNFQHNGRASGAHGGSCFKSIQPLNFRGSARRRANFILQRHVAATWQRQRAWSHALHKALIIIGERVLYGPKTRACLKLAGARGPTDNFQLNAFDIGRVID